MIHSLIHIQLYYAMVIYIFYNTTEYRTKSLFKDWEFWKIQLKSLVLLSVFSIYFCIYLIMFYTISTEFLIMPYEQGIFIKMHYVVSNKKFSMYFKKKKFYRWLTNKNKNDKEINEMLATMAFSKCFFLNTCVKEVIKTKFTKCIFKNKKYFFKNS